MDVRDYRGCDALGPQSLPDSTDVVYIRKTRDGDTDDLGPGGGKTPALSHSLGYIMGMSVAHCLDNNFVIASYNNVSYIDFQ
jgi:hypothetical protein